MKKMVGKQSLEFENPPFIRSSVSIVGKKEGEGPLGQYFDMVVEDPLFGQNSWEESESYFQKTAVEEVLKKANMTKDEIRYLFAGDLQAQCIATTFGLLDFEIPLFGLFGACSTIGEALSLGAAMVSAGYADDVIAITSSHLGSAEKTFRFPLGYGNQRPLTSSWTVTGSGAFILSNKTGNLKIRGCTTGKIKDYGIKDAMNMGAAMAPAAADVIYQHFEDFGVGVDHYDQIITGDLGAVGHDILIKLLKDNGHDISSTYTDCGVAIYDKETQDTHAGGSGCGCSATVMSSYITDRMYKKEWKRILFVPTGALLSTVSFNEGQSVPGIAHAVIIEVAEL